MIGAYERTALYAKLSAFVERWYVDLGDRVKQGAPLVDLAAPELVEQSRKLVHVAQSNVTAATEMVHQTHADVNRYQADVERWDSEVKRLTGLVGERRRRGPRAARPPAPQGTAAVGRACAFVYNTLDSDRLLG